MNLNLIIPESINTINILREDAEGKRWPFCYLHGNAEFIYHHDIFMADADMPTSAGNYLVDIAGAVGVAVIREHNGSLEGRVVLLTDHDALLHALNVPAWA